MTPASYDDPDYFEQLYARDPDPWQFATSDYERDKYAATIEALPPGKLGPCFEVGCSIGVLTQALGERCESVLAVDIAEGPLTEGRRRCAHLPGVTFSRMVVPQEWPAGRFGVILFSEVLYYLGIPGLHEAARRTLACLAPGGTVILVNWRGPTDGACTGEEAAELFIADALADVAAPLKLVSTRREEKYRLDVLRRD